MKKVFTALGLTLCVSGMASSALAAESCADKRHAIEKEINYAKQHNNTGKLVGLEKALREVNRYCTPESIREDARKKVVKSEKKLAEKRDDISKTKAELNKAMARGKQDKISKYQEKIADKKREEQKIIRQLAQEKSELSGR